MIYSGKLIAHIDYDEKFIMLKTNAQIALKWWAYTVILLTP